MSASSGSLSPFALFGPTDSGDDSAGDTSSTVLRDVEASADLTPRVRKTRARCTSLVTLTQRLDRVLRQRGDTMQARRGRVFSFFFFFACFVVIFFYFLATVFFSQWFGSWEMPRVALVGVGALSGLIVLWLRFVRRYFVVVSVVGVSALAAQLLLAQLHNGGNFYANSSQFTLLAPLLIMTLTQSLPAYFASSAGVLVGVTAIEFFVPVYFAELPDARVTPRIADACVPTALPVAADDPCEPFYAVTVTQRTTRNVFLFALTSAIVGFHFVVQRAFETSWQTARRRAQHANKKREQARADRKNAERIFHSRTHEQKTMLAGAIGSFEELRARVDELSLCDTRLLETMSDLYGCLQNMDAYTKNDLLHSRLQRGTQRALMAQFNCVQMVVDMTRNAARGFKLSNQVALNIYLDCSRDVRSFDVIGDNFAFEGVVNNLVTNAVKYTQFGRIDVVVRVHPLDNEMLGVTVEVADTGCGIPLEFQPLIFDANQRGSQAFGHIRGSGIGLSNARRLAEQLNGSITFVSVSATSASGGIDPMSGSTFTAGEFVFALDNAPPSSPLSPLLSASISANVWVFGDQRFADAIQSALPANTRLTVERFTRYTADDLQTWPHAESAVLIVEQKVGDPAFDNFAQVFAKFVQQANAKNSIVLLATHAVNQIVVADELRETTLRVIEMPIHPRAWHAHVVAAVKNLVLPRTATKTMSSTTKTATSKKRIGKRVLVMEDDRLLRKLLRVVLQKRGCDVVDVASGREGVKEVQRSLLDKCPFDFVFTDFNMPVNGRVELNGKQASDEIRALHDAVGKALPTVVVLSGNDVYEEFDKFGQETYHFVSKPIPADTIDHLLRNRLKS